MNKSCPISFDQVNEQAVRLNAALTVMTLILFFLTTHKWIILLLGVDFFIRGFLDVTFSYYSFVSKSFLRMFNISPVMVNAGPKIFAAKIGFIFCCMLGMSFLLEFQTTGIIIGSVFMFFAALESVFKFCMACQIYPLICK